MALGHYDLAHRLLESRWPKPLRREAALLLAGLALETGRYDQAEKVYRRLVAANPMDWPARAGLGRVLVRLGRRQEAQAHFQATLTGLTRSQAEHSPEDWLAAGLAAWGLGRFQAASDAFEVATKADPTLDEAWIFWAELAMVKYKVDWTDEFLGKVLKRNPRHPRALADMAWLEWFAPRGRHERGEKYARKALAVNPRQVQALQYLASVRIFNSRYEEALRYIRRALQVNPRDLRTLALLAAVRLLRDNRDGYEAVVQKTRFAGSDASRFYEFVARFLTRHHRYEQAAKLSERAVELDPDNAEALADLGVGLLRTGRYHRGWAVLQQAWAKDKYNYRTYNLLNLYDTIKARYVWMSGGPFRFLVPKDERALLARYVPRILVEAERRYEHKYGIRPSKPIFVELYERPEDFQTRTFGEPAGAGIMGVCFGRVITAMSPSVGRTNWAYVLWHELAHVFHIQMTGGRVPRWFTEGLAEYETMVARPYWKREYAALLHRQILARKLPGILDINDRFTHSKTLLGVVLAYYQSSLFVSFIAEKWGFDTVVRILRAYAKGATTRQVLTRILRIDPRAFDKAFAAFFYRRFPFLKGQFDPYVYRLFDTKELLDRAKAHPNSAAWQARAGCNLQERKGPAAAAPYFQRAAALNPGQPELLFCRAHAPGLAPAEAYDQLHRLLEKRDCYEVRMALAALALRIGRPAEAERHLRAASRWNPEAPQPWARLALLKKKQGQELESAKALYRLAWIQQTSPSVSYTALKLLAKHKQWALVRKLGPLAIHLQPFNASIHEKFAWALRAAGRHDEALFEFESALLAKPRKPLWPLMGKALSLAVLGRKRQALETLERVLDLDPNFMPAVRLKRRLAPEEEY